MCLYDSSCHDFGQSGIRRVQGLECGCLGLLVMKLDSSPSSHAHKDIHMHTLKLANFKGSKGQRTLWLWPDGREKLTGLSLLWFYLLLCLSAPLFMERPHSPLLSIFSHANLQPNSTLPIFFQRVPLSPGEDPRRMELWLSWYILDNKAEWLSLSFLFSCRQRAPAPSPHPNALFLHAQGSLDTDRRSTWKDSGYSEMQGTKQLRRRQFPSLLLVWYHVFPNAF